MYDDPRIRVLSSASIEEQVEIRPNNGHFELYSAGQSIAQATRSRWLADWAFAHGALAVRYAFDLGIEET